MPEVVEVCTTAQYIKHKIANADLISVTILGGKYKKKTLMGLSILDYQYPLKLLDVNSKGKRLWFRLESAENKLFYIFSSFGLEGRWGFEKTTYSHIRLEFLQDGEFIYLYFTDHRNFGNIMITDSDKVKEQYVDELAPDFLKETLTTKILKDRINNLMMVSRSAHKKKIITILMEQKINKSLGSGLGNYLVAEILYRAKISPHISLEDLYKKPKFIKQLTNSIKYVLKLCYMTNETGYMKYLSDFIDTHKELIKTDELPMYHSDVQLEDDTFKFKVYRKKTDPDGHMVTNEEIIKGRTAYWVPDVQKA